MLHKVRRHADAVVLHQEYIIAVAPVEGGLLGDAEVHRPSGWGILHGVAQQVDEDLAQLQGVCDDVLVGHVEGVDEQLQPLGLHLGLDDIDQIVGQLGDVAGLILDLDLAALNAAHVQDVVDEAEQVVAGGEDLLEAVLDLLPVVDVADCDGGKADDGVHGGADVVGHIGQEGGLGPVGVLGLHQRLLEGLGLLPLLLDLGGDILGDHHDHDVPGAVVPRHDKGLTHAHLLPAGDCAPVIHRDLLLSLFEPLPQALQVDRGVVFLQGLLQDAGPPLLKALGGGAGGLQPCPFQEGDLLAVHNAGHIVLHQVPGEIELKGAEGGGGNGNPVLPLLAVGLGDYRLRPQLLLLQPGDVLPEEQDLAGPALPPLQADDIEMLPGDAVPALDPVLVLEVRAVQQFQHNGIPIQHAGKFLPVLFHQEGAQVADKVLIAALGGEILPLRRGPGQVLVGVRLQVRQDEAGKESAHAADDIAHLPVLPLQPQAVLPASEQQGHDVQDEQADKNDLQDHAGMVGVPDHGLGHALGEGLDQDILPIREGDGAQIVRQTAGGADKAAAVRFAPEDLPGPLGRLGVDDAALQQHVRQGVVVGALRAGDDVAVRRTQERPGGLAEVAGGQHFPEVVRSGVQPQQHAVGLALAVEGRVKDDHSLPGDAGFKHHGGAALPLHSLCEIDAVQAVVDAPVGGEVDALAAGKAQGVKVRVVLQLPQQVGPYVRLLHRRTQQIGVVAYPPQAVEQLAVEPQGSLAGGVHGVIQVALLDLPAVCGGVPLKQKEDCR